MANLNNPWQARDAWRTQGVFSKAQRFKGVFPGFYTGVALFLAVSLYEDYVAPQPEKKAHH